jgi:hypothetical protein
MNRQFDCAIRNRAVRSVWLAASMLVLVAAGCATHEVKWDQHLGQSRDEVIAKLGAPAREEPYYTGMGHARPPFRTTRTLVYENHDGSNTFVAFEEEDGKWVCYRFGSRPEEPDHRMNQIEPRGRVT